MDPMLPMFPIQEWLGSTYPAAGVNNSQSLDNNFSLDDSNMPETQLLSQPQSNTQYVDPRVLQNQPGSPNGYNIRHDASYQPTNVLASNTNFIPGQVPNQIEMQTLQANMMPPASVNSVTTRSSFDSPINNMQMWAHDLWGRSPVPRHIYQHPTTTNDVQSQDLRLNNTTNEMNIFSQQQPGTLGQPANAESNQLEHGTTYHMGQIDLPEAQQTLDMENGYFSQLPDDELLAMGTSSLNTLGEQLAVQEHQPQDPQLDAIPQSFMSMLQPEQHQFHLTLQNLLSMPQSEEPQLNAVQRSSMLTAQPARDAIDLTGQPGNILQPLTEQQQNRPSGRGRKRKTSSQTQATDESASSKKRKVGIASCDACREMKVKCEPHENGSACKRCHSKNIDCVQTGTDKRTTKTKCEELSRILKNYHGMIWEFVAVLKFLAPGNSTSEKGKEARLLFGRGLHPHKILEVMGTPQQQWAVVPGVAELRKYCKAYDKLKDVRTAIEASKASGTQILCSLYSGCVAAINAGQENDLEMQLQVEEAAEGKFSLNVPDMFFKPRIQDLFCKEGVKPLSAVLEFTPDWTTFHY
ncbi:hypothetical protein F4677DRAFT_440342 [Hypoxylon crocopeplum]|nr:hypothetical protein F4677DRAFT_440342 [Hypoxylon crocopeplum]